MNPETNPEVQLVREHVNALAEHFDTVQIFVLRYDAAIEDATHAINLGTGIWHARYGQVREWVIKEEEQARLDIHKRKDNQ